MRPAFSNKPRARACFWAMLFIAAVGSVGMQTLALLARGAGDDAWVDAVYRFDEDALPSCEQLAGRAQLLLADRDLSWARLAGLEASTAVDGRCRSEGRVVM